MAGRCTPPLPDPSSPAEKEGQRPCQVACRVWEWSPSSWQARGAGLEARPRVGVAGAGSARRASGPQRQPGFAKEEPALCSQYLSRLMTVKTPYIQYPAERRLDSFFRWLFDSEIPRAIFGTYIGNLKAALLNK